jgi:hypothetical protein
MADDVALKNAIAHRDDLAKKINGAQQQIDIWRRELSRADAFIADWHSFAGVPVPGGKEEIQQAMAILGIKRKNSKKEDVAAEVRKILDERNEPMSRAELFRELIELGYVIEGTDPEMVLSTMLWRTMGKFGLVRVKTGGYWIKERPCPEVGYDPKTYGPLQSAFNTPVNEIPNPDAPDDLDD